MPDGDRLSGHMMTQVVNGREMLQPLLFDSFDELQEKSVARPP
jgi:hypothetical protein